MGDSRKLAESLHSKNLLISWFFFGHRLCARKTYNTLQQLERFAQFYRLPHHFGLSVKFPASNHLGVWVLQG
jgi:hypothetical protein